MAGAKKAIQILNQSPWNKSRLMGETPFPFLIFPLVVWRFENEDDDASDQVFLRGIKGLFHRVGDELRGDLSEPFATIESLLRTVPMSRLATALTKGKCFPDPGACLLIHILKSIPAG